MSVDDLIKEYGVEGSVKKRKVDTYRGKSVKEYRTVFNKKITNGIEYLQGVDKVYTVDERNLIRRVHIKNVENWEIRIRHRGEYLKIDGKNNYFYLEVDKNSERDITHVTKLCDKLNGMILNGEVDTRIEQYIKSVKKKRSKSKKSKSTKEVTQSE